MICVSQPKMINSSQCDSAFMIHGEEEKQLTEGLPVSWVGL
jgi:hypothetical protein